MACAQLFIVFSLELKSLYDFPARGELAGKLQSVVLQVLKTETGKWRNKSVVVFFFLLSVSLIHASVHANGRKEEDKAL